MDKIKEKKLQEGPKKIKIKKLPLFSLKIKQINRLKVKSKSKFQIKKILLVIHHLFLLGKSLRGSIKVKKNKIKRSKFLSKY